MVEVTFTAKEEFSQTEANGFNRKNRRALKSRFNFATVASNVPLVKRNLKRMDKETEEING